MTITILGKVPSKKNSRITTMSGRSFPNQTFVKWEKDAMKQLHLQKWSPITKYPVTLECKFFMPDLVSRDLDNMLSSVMDLIKDQKKKIAGKMTVVSIGMVTEDDWKHIGSVSVTSELDRLNPRVEVSLY